MENTQTRRDAVRLVSARAAPHDTVLKRLNPLYLHELSAFTDYYRIDREARWQPDHLPDWLTFDLQHPFVVYCGDLPVGLSLVAEAPFEHMAHGGDYQLFEFFVIASHRRRGIGRAAALATFARFPPGEWVVTEVPRNTAAQSFWRGVIGELTNGDYTEEVTESDVLQRFTTRA